MKNNIILEQDGNVESHGSLSGIAEKYPDLKVSTLRRKKFPFRYKGINFLKVRYNEKGGQIEPRKN